MLPRVKYALTSMWDRSLLVLPPDDLYSVHNGKATKCESNDAAALRAKFHKDATIT